jgi:hypothetical protein
MSHAHFPAVICSLLRPQLCLQVLPQASQAAQPRDPRTRSQLLWDAAKCRAAPDTSQERQALKNQLEVLQGGLEAAEQPRWATQLELPPHMDIVCFWEDLLDTHLMHFDMVRWVKPVNRAACSTVRVDWLWGVSSATAMSPW